MFRLFGVILRQPALTVVATGFAVISKTVPPPRVPSYIYHLPLYRVPVS